MIIYLGSDHAGFQHKEELRRYLISLEYNVVDMGANKLDPKDDYPDFIAPVARAVASDPEHGRGVIFGGSGQGEAMVANRFKNVRAMVWYGKNERIITLSREHNDANVFSIGARFVSMDEMKQAVKLWLETPFSGDERHERRVKKIDQL